MAVAGELVIKTKVDNSGVEKGLKETDAILEENNNKTEENEDVQKRIAEAQERIKKAQEETKQAEERIAKAKQETLQYTEEIAQIEEQNEAIKENLQYQKEIQKKVEEIGNSIQRTTKKVVKWGLAIMGVQGAFSFIRSSMNIISQQDKELANDISYIRTALAYTLEPVVRVIVNLMKQLLILIGGVVKLVTGRNIFEEANKGLANANKQAKDLKKQLAGFDEMNVLSDTSSGGGGGGTEGFDPGLVDNMSVEIEKGIGMWKQFGAEMQKATNLSFDDWIDAFGKWGILMEGITLTVQGLWEIVDGFFVFLRGLIDVFIGLLTGDEELIMQGIVGMLDGLWEIIQGFIDLVAGIVNMIVGLIVGLVVSLVEIVWEIIKGLGELIWSFIKTGFSLIQGIFTTLIGVLTSPFKILWETAQTVFNNIINAVKGVFNVIKGIFTGDMKTVLNGFKQIFKSTFDALWGIVKAPLNLVIEGINALIKGINKISFDVPDWVPIIGGQKWGFNIPQIKKLAKGTIVSSPGKGVPTPYGNARYGEAGREAYLPLSDTQLLEELGSTIGKYININATVPVYVGNRQIAREIRKINAEDDFAYNGG